MATSFSLEKHMYAVKPARIPVQIIQKNPRQCRKHWSFPNASGLSLDGAENLNACIGNISKMYPHHLYYLK